ncbi:hypothetical protein [Mucilaginibacter corticis]|uniref:hypothetical protein n=1 Tax=Mucilaginibacter corticis TaxID=2597670 RepID=UPI0016433843|nr:hypothetical protein [Mucilaginibacter corticis]
MKKDKTTGLLPTLTQQQCKLYQQIAHFAHDLDRLPDAREARSNKLRPAPQALLPMVF